METRTAHVVSLDQKVEPAVSGEIKKGSRKHHPSNGVAYAAGLDIGYAYVKWVDQAGDKYALPTAVAPVDLDNGLRGQARQEDIVVTVDHAPYLVGYGAIWSGRRLSDHLRWDSWWHSITYRAILAALAKRVPPGGVIVTGIPWSLPLTSSLSEPIERLIRQTLRARKVVVTQQGSAAALSLDLLNEEAQIGLIDIGGRTSEFVTIVHGQISLARSGGIRAGVCELYESLAAECRTRWQWDIDGYVIEHVLRGAMTVPRLSSDKDGLLQELRERLRTLAKPVAERLVGKCRDLWHDGHWLDRVVVCGGGASMFLEAIQGWRRDVVVPPDGQWLNARGYAALAKAIADETVSLA